MNKQKYEVRQRQSDKRWCIYLMEFNAVVAEFVEDIPQGDIDEIGRYLTSSSSRRDKAWVCPKCSQGGNTGRFCDWCQNPAA